VAAAALPLRAAHRPNRPAAAAELREVEASVQRFDALHRRFNAQVDSTINATWQPPSV
jgi:hypothetical protein